MTHWKLTLAYNGSSFHGWQIQPGLVTVQGTLAAALAEITGHVVLPQGSGRTDAGVHALGQVASFALPTRIPPANLQRALNRALPPDVRVLKAEIMPEGFHARHSARRKIYEYRIFERRTAIQSDQQLSERICSPFLAPLVWDCRWLLHLPLLQDAADQIKGTQDFSAMAASSREPRPEEFAEGGKPRSPRPNPVKTIYGSQWTRADGLLTYRICGSGFLHHMVRNLVGTMVDIGRGAVKLEQLRQILASRERSQAGPTAPASGLFLVEVLYPGPDEENVDASTDETAPEPMTVAAGLGT